MHSRSLAYGPIQVTKHRMPGYLEPSWEIARQPNAPILDARELPILSMFERIKGQLITRFYKIL